MLDKIEEILNNLKERLTSPFFSSFLISWIVFNWKIVVPLFWYHADQIIASGHKNLVDLISANLDTHQSLLYPLYFALGYTFIYPVIRNLINAFLSWTNRWGDNWNLDIQKSGSIPISRYMELKKIYDQRTKQVEKVIKDESQSIIKIASLESQLAETKLELNDNKKLNNDYIVTINKQEKDFNQENQMRVNAEVVNQGLKSTIEFHEKNNKDLQAKILEYETKLKVQPTKVIAAEDELWNIEYSNIKQNERLFNYLKKLINLSDANSQIHPDDFRNNFSKKETDYLVINQIVNPPNSTSGYYRLTNKSMFFKKQIINSEMEV